jgi:hypothetical protein
LFLNCTAFKKVNYCCWWEGGKTRIESYWSLSIKAISFVICWIIIQAMIWHTNVLTSPSNPKNRTHKCVDNSKQADEISQFISRSRERKGD